jgi:hypothetical protein
MQLKRKINEEHKEKRNIKINLNLNRKKEIRRRWASSCGKLMHLKKAPFFWASREASRFPTEEAQKKCLLISSFSLPQTSIVVQI